MGIALLGACGKIGCRLAANLKRSRYDVRQDEVGDARPRRLIDGLGLSCVPQKRALDGATIVIFAVPQHADRHGLARNVAVAETGHDRHGARRGRTTELMSLCDIFSHPGGPAAGGRAVRQAREATVAGIPLESFPHEHVELAQSLAKFGGADNGA